MDPPTGNLSSVEPVAATESHLTAPPTISSDLAASSAGQQDDQAKKRGRLLDFASKKGTGSSRQPQSSTPTTDAADVVPSSSSFEPTATTTTMTSTTMTSSTSTMQSEQGTTNAHLGHRISPSPARRPSSSPRILSPASSQIFERDVLETVALQPKSPAIPSHIQTEDYIPSVLDASSEAITDNHLDPDSVEIITHSSHQPIAASVASTGAQTPHPLSPAVESNWADELAASYSRANAASIEREDSASHHGSTEPPDVRRLSFISFADVVLSEHAVHGGLSASRESIHMASLTSFAHRSQSPIRSLGSNQASPLASSHGSVKGVELSPTRKPIGSPTSTHATMILGRSGSGDINIETMTQALRRTGSTDMIAIRSIPTSPIEAPSH